MKWWSDKKGNEAMERVFLSIEHVRKMVTRVTEAAASGDFEKAHAAEDNLFGATLGAIADGAPNPQDLAAEALKANDIDYPRHCG